MNENNEEKISLKNNDFVKIKNHYHQEINKKNNKKNTYFINRKKE